MSDVEQVVDAARGDVDPALLTRSLTGDATSGYLVQPAIDYVALDEAVQYVFHNESSATIVVDGGTKKSIRAGRGWTLVIVTDKRVILAVGDAHGEGRDSRTVCPFYDLRDVDARTGILKNKFVFETPAYTYRVPVQADDDVEAAVDYIEARREGRYAPSTAAPVWSVSALYSVSPTTFETILADLWATRGYDAETTQASQDMGIDVVATADGETVLIQAKRYRPGNNVGIGTVQRAAGLLADGELDPTAVVVATTADFTSNARDRADQTPDLDLLPGTRLADSLRQSDLSPAAYNITRG